MIDMFAIYSNSIIRDIDLYATIISASKYLHFRPLIITLLELKCIIDDLINGREYNLTIINQFNGFRKNYISNLLIKNKVFFNLVVSFAKL